jgi:hypothetical protein
MGLDWVLVIIFWLFVGDTFFKIGKDVTEQVKKGKSK